MNLSALEGGHAKLTSYGLLSPILRSLELF